MKFFRKPLFLICSFAFSIAFAPATQAVDGCSSAGFKVATSVNLGATPFGLASGDFNSDGHLDLVAALNNGSTELTVLYGRGGTQGFGPPTYFSAGGRPLRITVGDLNGDGKPDLAVTLDRFGLPSSMLSILLNDGTGAFGAPNLISLTGDPYRAVLGDLNNDGKLDIVAGLYTGTDDGKVAILLGNGGGGFSHAANSPLSTFSVNPAVVAIGDFNEDGKRDLAIPGTFSGGLDIRLGDGTGSFGPPVHTATNGHWISLTVGDFNEDGHLDVLMDDRMMLGTGTATFAAPIVVGLPASSSAALGGDVNQDGHLDVLVSGTGGLTVMLGNGTGNLVQGKSYTSGYTIFGTANSFAALGDFNEDTKVDIAAVLPQGIGILDGDGTGAFNDALSYHTSIMRPRYLLAADFNNDGNQDLATASSEFLNLGQKIEVALGDGSGGFTNKSVTSFGAQPRAIAAADFNSDGKSDLAVTLPSNGRVTILLNDGTGGFPTDGSSALSYTLGFQPTAIKTGDFNNDTKADLVVITTGFNRLVLLLGDGSGAFINTAGALLQGTSSFSDDLAIGDFDADGKPDVAVVRSGANVVHVLKWNDGGFFSTMAIVPVPGLPISVVVRDFNGDGKPDIAVSNSVQETLIRQPYITVLINNGASGFDPGTSYPTDAAGIIGIGDFNSDTYPDLAVSSGAYSVGSNLDGIAVLTNKGNGDFNAPVNFSAGPVSDHLAVGDFNSDSKDDVLISQPLGHSIGLLLNNFSASQPCLSVDDVTVTENDSGTTDAIFTVKLSAASAQTVRVNYLAIPAFLSGITSATTKGADFEDTPGTVTFLPGETTQTITIRVKGDLTDEFDQYFYVVLTTPINAAISDGKGLGTIVDNDPPAAISVNDIAIAEGTLVDSSATFTLSLNAPSEKPISVQYALAAGTATVTTDYSDRSGTVEFDTGTVSRTISVPIIKDNIFEPDETFFVNLSNATNATIADGQGQGTITNDDPQPTIGITASVSRTEGATGTTVNAVFEVKLSNPSYQAITVSYGTADVTATAGSDYTATSGSFTFNPGETSGKFVTVVVTGDNTDEINETYAVNLSNPTNATISVAQGVGTIQDDDGPTLSIGNVVVTEGNSGFTDAVFTVTLSFASVQDITVNYATGGFTAVSNVDFQRVVSSTLFIPAGTPSGTITIRVIGDLLVEPDEQFFVNLQGVVNATVATPQGTGTIVNDDAAIQMEFATYNLSEGIGNAEFHVKRTGATGGVSTVNFITGGNGYVPCNVVNGSAVQNCDFTLSQGTLTFTAGQTDAVINLLINDDAYVEGNETLSLTLSNPVGATLGSPGAATLTIVDNDAAGTTVPAPKTFIATLSSNQEVPPTGTTGKGGGMVQLNAAETSAKVGLVFSTMSSAQTAAHIHGPAPVGTNAPILFPLPNGTVIDFNISPTAQQVSELKAGQHYLNVHTANFINGEIRGQLLWNPLNEVDYFVQQHYYDFLGRGADPGGLAFWTNELKQCGLNVQCFRDKSIDVSNAFFYEQEYQQTASYVFLLYRAAYGNTQPFPNPDGSNPTEANKIPQYLTFVGDRAQVVGGANLAASQKALADAFVQRAEFTARYPLSLTGPQFVAAVLANIQGASGANLATQQAALETHYTNGGRGLVVFHLANDYWNGCNRLPGNPAAPCVPAGYGAAIDNRAFIDAEYNRSFVYSQYSGYLRRDADIGGFVFWLNQVSAAPPRNAAKQHGMVCAFVTSAEYQARFGSNIPRTNAECIP